MRASRLLFDDVDDLVQEVADTIQEAGIYRDTGVTVDDLRSAHRSNLVALLGFLSGNPGVGLAAPRATGRLRGDQGTPLPAVLRAYRIGASVVWDRLVSMAGDDADARAELLSTASAAWRIFDEYTQAVTVSYQEEVAECARRDAAIRRAALDALLAGQVTGGQMWDCATKLRMPQHGTFVVVVAALADHAADEALPGIDSELTTLGVRSAWRLQLASQVGVVSLTDTFTVERLGTIAAARCMTSAGMSTPYGSLDQTHTALRQAQLACTAARSEIHQVLRYENALVPALLASVPDVADALTTAVLGPVLDLPATDRDVLIETLRCWLDSGSEIATVAAKLYCHRNTVRSRLNRIAEASGCELSSPAGIARLYLAMEAHRIAQPG